MILFWLIIAGLVGYAIHSGVIRKPLRHEALAGGLAFIAAAAASRGAMALAAAAAAGAAAVWLSGEAVAKRAIAEETRALQTLGLEPGASVEDIRAAHRRLSATAHPDRGGTDAAQQALNAARDLLLRRRGSAMR